MNLAKSTSALLFAALALATLSGCAGTATPKDRTQVCSETFDRVEKGFEKEKYFKIREDIEQILDQCRGTGFVERTQFMLAESHFRMKEWIEARGEYNTFALNFPSSPYAETATYRKAVSSFNMSYSDMRDDSPTQTAQMDFDDFISNYPTSTLKDSVEYYQQRLTDRLAEKEYQIARLYWRMGEPLAAAIYLKSLLVTYPKTDRLYDAYLMIIDSYILIEQFEQAEFYMEHLKANFPDAKGPYESRKSDIASAKVRVADRVEQERKKKLLIKEEGT